MAIIGDAEKRELAIILSRLVQPVRIINFTQTLECRFCGETRQLLTELCEQDKRLKLEVYNFQSDPEPVKTFGIDKIPATVVMGEKDYGIRFYGTPAGYEFASLLSTIVHVSMRDSGLPESVRLKLKQIENPVHLQVLVTPTCPFCPTMVMAANKFSIENDMIRADMIEGAEFPHLFQKYEVAGVPRTVINETHFVEGLVPEPAFADEIIKSVMEGK